MTGIVALFDPLYVQSKDVKQECPMVKSRQGTDL